MRKPRILQPCRRQAVMKIEAPEDLIPSDHPARLFARVVDGRDLSKLTEGAKAVEHGAGRPTLCHGMLQTLWLYATSKGVGSAREIERLVKSDDAFTWIVGDLEVGRFALTELRVSHGEALLSLMADILGALVHQGLLRLDTVALDGTRVRASASAPSFRSLRSLQECREQALLHVHAVLADADNPEISARQQAASEAAARDILRRTVRSNGGGDRDGDEARGGAGHQGTAAGPALRASPCPPRGSTCLDDRRRSPRDEDARRWLPAWILPVRGRRQRHWWTTHDRRLDVVNVGSDMGAIEKMIPRVETATGSVPNRVLADGNHLRHACIDDADSRGVVVCAPPNTRAKAREHDSAAVRAWRERMTTDEATRIYRGRAALAELPNAFVKSHCGLDRVLVRGLAKVTCVALLAALTFNIAQNAAHLV